MAAALVDVWIDGIIFLGALIVRLNIGNLRPFVLGKAENGKLRLTRLFLPPFLLYEVIAQRISQLHDIFVADALPLQFCGQVGDAAASIVFISQSVNDLLHRKTGTNDLRFDLISDAHKILLFFRDENSEAGFCFRKPASLFGVIFCLSEIRWKSGGQCPLCK